MKHGNKYSDYISKLYRPTIKQKYVPGYIHLNHNEAPYSGFDKSLNIKNLRQYPDPIRLYNQISEYYGVKTSEAMVTRGSEQGIQYVFNTFLGKGKNVIYPNPSFGMYDVFAYQNHASVKYLDYIKNPPKLENIKKLVDRNTALVVIANPENPSGTWMRSTHLDDIVNFLRTKNIPILIDEAYTEYFGHSAHSLLSKINYYPNLIITRTMSKGWGLAGARIGFVFSNADNIHLLSKWRYMDEIDSIASEIAVRSLYDSSMLDKNVRQVEKWRMNFKEEFQDLYKETKTNFIILKTKKNKEIYESLAKQNIITQYQWDHPFMDEKIRFSVSSDSVMKRIVKAIKKVFI